MTAWSRFQFVGMVILCFVVCLSIVGCGGSRVSKANADKITKDMTEAQVKDILGAPTETTGQGGNQVSVWKSGDDTISVTFLNGKVAGKISSYDLKEAFGK
jgi:hypothetical protein